VNANADALSRDVRRDAPGLEEERNVHAIKEDIDDTNIYTEEEKKQILYEYHDTSIGGHQGVERILKRIRLNHNRQELSRTSKITWQNANHVKRINYRVK